MHRKEVNSLWYNLSEVRQQLQQNQLSYVKTYRFFIAQLPCSAMVLANTWTKRAGL